MLTNQTVRFGLVFCISAGQFLTKADTCLAADLTEQAVIESIEDGSRFLVSQQRDDGSWRVPAQNHPVGVHSLALLALINAGMSPNDRPIQRGLQHLRSIPMQEPDQTYDVALMIMALAAAKDGGRDRARILSLANRLEEYQFKGGENTGAWSYGETAAGLGGDNSNTQYAILGLRDAVHAGIPVSRETWRRADRYWRMAQNGDGGWGYTRTGARSTGSMTVAGIASLMITSSMLRDDSDLDAAGNPNCCGDYQEDEAIRNGLRWMETHFAVGHNPGGSWLLYYLYGMERAGRLSGRRFFGENARGRLGNDWYREGAAFLLRLQRPRDGSWIGDGHGENNPIVGTSFSLLFLSKGLAPVMISKMEFQPADPGVVFGGVNPDIVWNQHPNDVRHLTELITGLDKWPKLLNWQTLNFDSIAANGSVTDLLQAPIIYFAGQHAPRVGKPHVELLREYVEQGGFIFAVNCCNGAGFDESFRGMIQQMYPNKEAELKRLPPDHPVFFSEYPLDPESVELWGVDFGCRTAIIYSPEDIACLWEKWARQDPPRRSPQLKSMIRKATSIGVNVVAYATGREPPLSIHEPMLIADSPQEEIERGFLQIAKIRHNGGWDTAPQALKNLLVALNQAVGTPTSAGHPNLSAADDQIQNFPMLYMHGRHRFALVEQEQTQLLKYLERGGVLFADACCGSSQFDGSFRNLIGQMYPDLKFERIPIDHELFSADVGFDIKKVRRRGGRGDGGAAGPVDAVRIGEPFLEGIKIDGRYAVIYSKYDISCALERQSSVACAGYDPEDAVKIAINVVMYGMLQDVRYYEAIQELE